MNERIVSTSALSQASTHLSKIIRDIPFVGCKETNTTSQIHQISGKITA
jgi:hypothetical protein